MWNLRRYCIYAADRPKEATASSQLFSLLFEIQTFENPIIYIAMAYHAYQYKKILLVNSTNT